MKKFTLLISLITIVSFQVFAQNTGLSARGKGTVKSVLTEFTEFSDDFESGFGNWTASASSLWGLSTTKAYSPTHSLTESPSGNYTNNQTSTCAMTNGVDLTAKMSASVSFWAQFKIEAGFDYMYVDVSNDNFATFTNLAVFDGVVNDWTQYSYSLGGFVGPGNDNVKVRFRFVSDQGYVMDGMYIDDFIIVSSDEDHSPPLVITTPPEFYEGILGEFVVEAEVVDISGLVTALCEYTVDGVPQTAVAGINTSGNTYTFTIPAQSAGSNVDYQLVLTDASPYLNTTTTDVASYIAGEYYKYDNGIVDYFVSIFTGEGASVVFSLNGPTHIATALIRNYTDVDHLNTDMMFHLWAPNSTLTGPGNDLITPFAVTPEASLDNTSPMTRIDLRPYMAEIGTLSGDVFMGFTVTGDTVNLTETDGGAAGRTFFFDGTEWGVIAADFHFRLITTGSELGSQELPNNEISIAPNPMASYTFITTANNFQKPRVELFSLDGRNLSVRQVVNGNRIQLLRDRIPSGLYILRVYDGNTLMKQDKLIIR